MTLFKFICVLYQFHRQTLPIMETEGPNPISRVCVYRNGTLERSLIHLKISQIKELSNSIG